MQEDGYHDRHGCLNFERGRIRAPEGTRPVSCRATADIQRGEELDLALGITSILKPPNIHRNKEVVKRNPNYRENEKAFRVKIIFV